MGRTPPVERRGGRFVMREQDDISRLLGRAYGVDFDSKRIMGGLATVAAALNANDLPLACIAAVHLRIPDLPDEAARDAMEAEDGLVKYARDEDGGSDWDPALHPRTGTPPNPGWFAPTDGSGEESPRTRTAQNENPTQRALMSRQLRTTIGSGYLPANISTTCTISWSSSQTPSRKMNRRYALRLRDISTMSAIRSGATHSIASSATCSKPATTSNTDRPFSTASTHMRKPILRKWVSFTAAYLACLPFPIA